MSKETSEPHPNPQSLVDALAKLLEPHIREIAREVMEEQADLQAFTIRETMKRLSTSEYTVRLMIKDGKLEVVRPTERTVLITARSIRKLLYGDSRR